MWIRIVLFAIALGPAVAVADPAGKSLEKDFGVGLAIGVASGPNLQFKPTSHDAHIDLGFGIGSLHAMRFQADYAWRLYYFSRDRSSVVPLYVGGGAYFTDRTWGADVGVRIPIGVQAEFAEVPVQLFGEISPEAIVYEHIARDVMAPGRDRFTLRAMMGARATF
ncbi:MAG: hypothetical protein KF773_23895 [Deltaproteobacteria bacterium]|nr:hypothetical protein [Deltaproteobacteria bacterium]MCW5807666.1 hypothetical protein [Deltaproteobacteria bacterium]